MTEAIILAAALAALITVAFARRTKPTFRCDRCGQRRLTRERSDEGGWSDWCQTCASDPE